MDKRVKIFKALSNQTRMDILEWLKDPVSHFDKPEDQVMKNFEEKGGVCVGDIQEKSGLSQSTISSYLTSLENVGLLDSQRHGKWTYYRRNEANIEEFLKDLKDEL